MDDPRERFPKLAPVVQEHLGLLISLSISAITIARLFIVSGNNANALEIARTLGVTQVLVGVALTVAPSALAALLFVLWDYSVLKGNWRLLYLLLMSFVPPFWIISWIVVESLFWLYRRRHDLERRPVGASTGLWFVFSAVQIGFFAMPIWLPAEVIGREGEPPLGGYVLSDDDGGFYTVLDFDQTIVRMPADSVTSRTSCEEIDLGWSRWFYEPARWIGDKRPPKCDDLLADDSN